MTLTYDTDGISYDVFYLYTMSGAKVSKTKDDNGVYVDLDVNGKVIGFEFSSAEKLSRIPELLNKYNME